MNKVVILTFAVLLISACNKNDLRNSVFIYDEELTDLPAYSEWGYNTFGAYIDREVFISDAMVPAKIISHDTILSFNLYGVIYNNYYDIRNVELEFIFSNLSVNNFTELVMLNDSLINLQKSDCQVHLSIDTDKFDLNINVGDIYFKRVQILQVDDQTVEAILSGFFAFKTTINNKPVTISDGRFDVGIDDENFYASHNPY